MAKAKKGKLTIEDALVPVEEQPYEIPENWCWTRVKYISDVVTGSTPSKKNEEYYGGDFPFFKPADLDAGDNVIEASEYLSEEGKVVSRVIPELSTAVCCIGSIGKSGLLRVEGTTNQQINSMIPKINPLYLYYYSKTNEFVTELWDKSTATTISLVNKNNMETNTIPLAPLAEQKRIVEQIVSLFSKLDEAKEKATETIDSFDIRRQAILFNAFQGKLTEQWRRDNNCDIDSWRERIIKDVCHDIKVGIVIKPTQYYTDEANGVPAFRSANVRDSYIEDNDWVYINEKGQKENKRSEVHTGDVLIVRSGNPGTACVVNEEYDGYNAIDIIIAVPNQEEIKPEFLCYYTNSPECKGMVDSNKRGMALQHFNVGGYSKLTISVPTLEEQNEIIRIITRELEKEAVAKEKINDVIDKINLLKKSILAKAFRGELGTNVEEEESSIELLKQILNNGL